MFGAVGAVIAPPLIACYFTVLRPLRLALSVAAFLLVAAGWGIAGDSWEASPQEDVALRPGFKAVFRTDWRPEDGLKYTYASSLRSHASPMFHSAGHHNCDLQCQKYVAACPR